MKLFFKNLSSNQLLKKYLKVFSVDALVKGSGIILLPIYLKLMTQDEFGLYGYLIAIINTFSLVFNLGIYTAQSKLYFEYSETKRGSVLFTLNIILLSFMVLLLALIYVFNIDYPVINFLFKNPLGYAKYRIAVLVGVIVAVYSIMIVNFFLTSENIRTLQIFNITRILLVNSAVISVMYLTPGGDHALERIKYSTFIELLIICFFSFFYIRRMDFIFDKKAALKALKIGTPIVISAILGIFINLSDRYFIEKFGTLRDLSIYNLALAFANIIPFVFMSFQNIWLPEFLKEKDPHSNRKRSKKITIRLFIFFILLSLAILATLKVMLFLNIVDSKYENIIPLLPLVLMTSIVSSLTAMYSNHLIYLNKLYIIIVVGIPIAVLGVFLNIILVPSYNIYGAAFSTLCTSLCYFIAYMIIVSFFYKKRQYQEDIGHTLS